MPTITIQQIIHKEKKRIAITFDYNQKLVELIKMVPGYRYSNTKKLFHYPATQEIYNKLKEVLQGFAFIEEDIEGLKPSLSEEGIEN